MIRIQNVSKWYGSFQVLTDCSTEIKKGEVVVVDTEFTALTGERPVAGMLRLLGAVALGRQRVGVRVVAARERHLLLTGSAIRTPSIRLAREGRIGNVAPRFFGVPTNRSQRITLEVDFPEILARCRADAVDAVVLVPNCPVCHQTVALRGMEVLPQVEPPAGAAEAQEALRDRKSTRLNSSH